MKGYLKKRTDGFFSVKHVKRYFNINLSDAMITVMQKEKETDPTRIKQVPFNLVKSCSLFTPE